MAKFFQLPFGSGGDKTAVPNSTQSDGSVSYQQGYGPDYQRPKTDPNAKNIERDKQNQLFYDITDAIGQYQRFGAPEFITAAANGGAAFAYAKGARVLFTDGQIYTSTVANNNTTPGSASWVVDDAIRVRRERVFITSGTYTPSPGIISAEVELVGGGGGGGGSTGGSGTGSAGGGGGAGGYVRTPYTRAQLIGGVAMTVGTAAAGGVGTNPGGQGGATTFLGLQANGGGGGAGSAPTSTAAANASGGPGGAVAGGVLGTQGQTGAPGLIFGATGGIGGAGGSAQYGSGGPPAFPSGNGGNNATGYGAGGSGAGSTTNTLRGGDGGVGVIIVTEFCAY